MQAATSNKIKCKMSCRLILKPALLISTSLKFIVILDSNITKIDNFIPVCLSNLQKCLSKNSKKIFNLKQFNIEHKYFAESMYNVPDCLQCALNNKKEKAKNYNLYFCTQEYITKYSSVQNNHYTTIKKAGLGGGGGEAKREAERYTDVQLD